MQPGGGGRERQLGGRTAAYATFTDVGAAKAHVAACGYEVVVKASGLAAGKGVVLPESAAEAEARARVASTAFVEPDGPQQMSDAEWGKVVRAMWLMKNLTDAEGRARYGPAYRGIDYHSVRHLCNSMV